MQDRESKRSRVNRREFVKGAAATGAAAAFPWHLALAEGVPNEFDGSKFQLKAPEPNPKSGGVLKYAITSRPPHFDMHQSGTINSLGSQGCMFDNLIRRDPRDSGKTIIPDLAHSWEIAKDGKTYTFHLREGVQFHDGADFTSEDVKATYDRIVKPPSGVSIPRSTLFTTVSEITTPDKKTVVFKLSEPRPASFMMAAFASGWNTIVRKKTLEDNSYNLRRVVDIPGTGPFKSKRRVENEVWVMEKNASYWNKGLPYLDGIEFYHALPFSPELGSALLSNRVDYGRIVDPVTARKAKETKGMSSTNFYQSVIQGTWVNNKKKPLDDPRVRRALHLVLDKPVLVDVVKDVAPMMVGGFIYPFSEFATPKEELAKRVGYQADPTAAIKEAKALLAAAGQCGRHQGPRLPGPRGRLVQAVGTGHPGHAAAGAQYRDQAAHRGRIGVVRRRQDRQLRPRGRRRGVDAARPVGLLQRLVQEGRAAELRLLGQREVQRAAAQDRLRGRPGQAPGGDPRGRDDHGAGSAGPADLLGEDQRRLVQLREGPQSLRVFRHLRRVRFDTFWLDK